MSDTTPDTGTPTTQPANQINDDQADEVDWKAEAEKYQALMRKQEERAKANAAAAKELEKLRREAMTDQEKAVAEARDQARAEVLAQVGARLVDAEVRAAAAGRQVDTDALLEGLDRSRFLTDEGEPDREAIQAWVDRIAPVASADDTSSFATDLGQGARPPSGTALNGDPLLRDLKSKLGIR